MNYEYFIQNETKAAGPENGREFGEPRPIPFKDLNSMVSKWMVDNYVTIVSMPTVKAAMWDNLHSGVAVSIDNKQITAKEIETDGDTNS